MNYWFKILYITVLSRWILTPTSAEFTVGSCSFSSYNRVLGYILRGNVVSEYSVQQRIECRKLCDKAANCLSVNLFKKSENGFLCQLNTARKENSLSEQFVKSGGGEYFGMKVKHFSQHFPVCVYVTDDVTTCKEQKSTTRDVSSGVIVVFYTRL